MPDSTALTVAGDPNGTYVERMAYGADQHWKARLAHDEDLAREWLVLMDMVEPDRGPDDMQAIIDALRFPFVLSYEPADKRGDGLAAWTGTASGWCDEGYDFMVKIRDLCGIVAQPGYGDWPYNIVCAMNIHGELTPPGETPVLTVQYVEGDVTVQILANVDVFREAFAGEMTG